jgi:hypothetical protein
MKKSIMAMLGLALGYCVSGCCTTSDILSGNGNVTNGYIGPEMVFKVCTPVEKDTANQLNILSNWYREQWGNCFSHASIIKCREASMKSYNDQKKILLNLLMAMKDMPENQQRRMYNNVLKDSRLIFLH